MSKTKAALFFCGFCECQSRLLLDILTLVVQLLYKYGYIHEPQVSKEMDVELKM